MRQLFWLSLIICSVVTRVSGLQCKNPSLVSIRSNRKYVKSEGQNDFPLRKFHRGLIRTHTNMSSENEDGNLDKDVASSLVSMIGGETLDGAKKNQNTGRLLLIFVAFLYGSLNVVFRLVYAAPDPPSASALSFTRGWLAAASFLPILAANRNNNDDEVTTSTKEESSTNKAPLWKAALELAFWNFGAQGLLNIGLLFTDAARASFLTQSSVVITPIISIFAGQKVPQIVWAGCLSALAGLIMLSGGGDGGSGIAMAFSTGDLLVLGGALSWSMYLFRIATVGKRYPEIPLQALKTTLLAALYSVWFLSSAITLLVKGSSSIATLWPGWTNVGVWMLLLYSAVGPGAIADILQQLGQKEVSASEANVILSSEPIFTAICARLVLGEITSTTENIGGALIVIGALLASGA